MNDSALHAALERTVRSEALASAPRLRNVLTYLVDAEAGGRGDALTPYRVAVEAFSKPEHFDPAASASVRVEMARLRRCLATARAAAPDQVALEIPRGSYRPRLVAPVSLPVDSTFRRLASPPSGPGILVLAFRSRLPEEHRYLAEGVARTFFDELSTHRWLHVVDGLDIDGDETGVYTRCETEFECQFMVRGSVTEFGADGSFRLRLEMMDVLMRHAVWVFDRMTSLSGLEAREREMVLELARVVAEPMGVVTQAGLAPNRPLRMQGRWAAADLVMRFHHFNATDRGVASSAMLKARARALLDDWPYFALGHAIEGGVHVVDYSTRLVHGALRERALDAAVLSLERASDLDPQLELAAFMLAMARYFRGELDLFRAELQRALRLNANQASHAVWGGTMLCLAGDVDDGLVLLERGSMQTQHAIYYQLAAPFGWYAAGRIADAERVLDQLPAGLPFYEAEFLRAVVYAAAGRMDDAHVALHRALVLLPALRTELRDEIFSWIRWPALAERTWTMLAPLHQVIVAGG